MPPSRVLLPELRIAVVFGIAHLLVQGLPAVVMGRAPSRPLDYVTGFGFALVLVLGFRSLIPATLMTIVFQCIVAGSPDFLGVVVYLAGFVAGLSVVYMRAHPEPWMRTPSSVQWVVAGGLTACVVSNVGNEFLVEQGCYTSPGIQALICAIDWNRLVKGIARELSGIVSVAPVVLTWLALPLRNWCGLPPDGRSVPVGAGQPVIDMVLLGSLSVAMFGLAVITRAAMGVDLVLLGFAPLALTAVRHGVESAAATLAGVAVSGSLLWAYAGWGQILRLGDLRLMILTASVTTVVIAAYREERGQLRKRVEDRIRELRRLAASTEDARESERTRLSREVHDELGQVLTGLKMSLKILASGSTPDAEARLRVISADTSAVLAQVERIGTELAPELMGGSATLPASVITLAAEFERQFGLRCSVMSSLVSTPDPGRAHAIRQIVREALTNVARHAAASMVRISLSQSANWLRVEVADDGRGLTHATRSTRSSGLGVMGMKERALLLGGALTVQTPPGGGTVVVLHVPCSSSNGHGFSDVRR